MYILEASKIMFVEICSCLYHLSSIPFFYGDKENIALNSVLG